MIRAFIATITVILLLATVSSIKALAITSQNQCTKFDNITLQLSLAQDGMPPPFNLEQIQTSLGPKTQEINSTIATHSWVHKNQVLLVKTIGDNITTKMLIGNSDGSVVSKKMIQIYEALKSATSIWSIKTIQQQLGTGYITREKLKQHSWSCDYGSLTVTTDQNDNIVETAAAYQAPLESIETRIGPTHPEWDTKTDALGSSYRAWKRTFKTI